MRAFHESAPDRAPESTLPTFTVGRAFGPNYQRNVYRSTIRGCLHAAGSEFNGNDDIRPQIEQLWQDSVSDLPVAFVVWATIAPPPHVGNHESPHIGMTKPEILRHAPLSIWLTSTVENDLQVTPTAQLLKKGQAVGCRNVG